VQSATAYVGFTGSTGSATATEDILSWTYSTSGPAYVAPLQFEPENLLSSTVSSGPPAEVFYWPAFTDGAGLLFNAQAPGDNVTIPLTIAQAGTYEVQVAVREREQRGIIQLSINGNNVGPAMDNYYPAAVWQQFDLGPVMLAAGSQPFKFTAVGKNPSSNGYIFCVDYIRLIPR
jgi:hypothetical protein